MMKSYQELNVWQKSYSLVLSMYKVTSNFPKEETYGLVSQIRRAVVSVPTNIAEGFNRRSKKEYLQFLYISRGSLQELDCLLKISRDLNYLSNKEYLFLMNEINYIGKMLSGLIKSISKK